MPREYFEMKAKLALRKIQADKDADWQALADWGEAAKTRTPQPGGVIITAAGKIVGETFRVAEAPGAPGATYVDRESTTVDLAGNELDLALGQMKRALGQPVVHIPVWDLTQGSADLDARELAALEGKPPMSRVEMVARREQLGLSQSALAKVLNVKQNSLSQWETGARGIPAWLDGEITTLEGIQDRLVTWLCENSTEDSDGTLHIHVTGAPTEGVTLPEEFVRVAAAQARLDLTAGGYQATITE